MPPKVQGKAEKAVEKKTGAWLKKVLTAESSWENKVTS